MTGRRRFLALAVTASLMAGAARAQTWTWSFGSGKRVQGAGEIVSETRNLAPFESIRLAGHFKVRVRQEGREGVTLQADRNLLPLIETQVTGSGSDRVLEVGIKPGYSWSGLPAPELLVDVKTLRGLTLAGSGDVRIDALRSERIDLTLSGSGDVVVAVAGQPVDSVSQLLDAVAGLEPGKPAKLTALRGQKELALTLDIVQRKRPVATAPRR